MFKNALLITVDCLRADHLRPYGYNKETSPFLSSLSNRSVLFLNSYSSGPFTLASFPSIFTSSPPLEYGIFYSFDPERSFTSILGKRGFKTIGLNSNRLLSLESVYRRIFDLYLDVDDMMRGGNGAKRYPKILESKLVNRLGRKLVDVSSRIPLVKDIMASFI